MRLVFAGTPEFAATHLNSLIASQHQVVAVYTQPDRPSGRGQKSQMSPVKHLAQLHDLPVLQPTSLKTAEAVAELKALRPEVLIVVAYGLILPPAILAAPTFGGINSHASLLPRWRGAAPIQRAIEMGDAQTGISLMQMEQGLDTGPVISQVTTPIASNDTAGSLMARLANLGAKALVDLLDQMHLLEQTNQPTMTPTSQNNEDATYAAKIQKQEAIIQWQKPAEQIERQIRAFQPMLWCKCLWHEEMINIHEAQAMATAKEPLTTPGTVLAYERSGLNIACGEGALRITRLQFPGGKPMGIEECLQGKPHHFKRGQSLA